MGVARGVKGAGGVVLGGRGRVDGGRVINGMENRNTKFSRRKNDFVHKGKFCLFQH